MGSKHFPTIIALIMLIAMLGLMSNCSVDTTIFQSNSIKKGESDLYSGKDEKDNISDNEKIFPNLIYESPMESNNELDQNGEPIKNPRIDSYKFQQDKKNP
tara:strand:- start:60 stop:362 length:303 start_codon:yes stop_codon:yes gene_type:complete